jgi:hypothetical protein
MTTIDYPAAGVADAQPTAEDIAARAALAETRFLDGVRRRVAWQADQAARLRALPRQPAAPLDVLDLNALCRLVAAVPAGPRTPEWTAFLEELCELAEPDGRLPEILERLVRVVFAELL